MLNRTRLSSLDAFGLRDQRNRIYPALEASDGSTLSLDFTQMSSLDSRFTFTRSSTATFINSSGLVQYADANLVLQSESLATSPWTVQNGATTTDVSIINPIGGGTATQLTSAGASNAGLQELTLAANIPHTVRFWVRGGTSTQMQFGYFSGGFQTASGITVVGDGTVTGTTLLTITGLSAATWTQVTFVLASPASSGSLLFYPDTASPQSGKTNFVWGVQVNRGSTASPYYRTTTSAYHGPRFDYSPTTLTPRGLLIEGSATNLLTYSEDFSNVAWTKSNTNGSMTLTGTAPDNNATSRLLEENTISYAKHSLERSISISAGVHTLSVWLKEPTSNSRRYAHIQLADGQATAARYTIVADLQTGTITASGSNNGTAGAPTGTGHSITPYPNGWYRVTISMNHVSSPSYPTIILGDTATLFGGSNQPFYSATTPYQGLIVWGAQLEAGGASSYIPTGASTVQRAADICYIPDGDHSWFTSKNNCVLFMQCEVPRTSNFGNLMYLGQWSGGEYSYGYQVYSFSQSTVSINTKITAATSTDQGLFANQPLPINLKIAMCPNSNEGRLARAWNGTASETTGLTPTASRFPAWTQQARFGIGTSAASLGSSTACNIYVRTVKFFPFAMSNAALQSLTQ